MKNRLQLLFLIGALLIFIFLKEDFFIQRLHPYLRHFYPEKKAIKDVSWEQFKDIRTMVVLSLGQSNVANFGWPMEDSTNNVYNFHDGQFYRGDDPMKGASGTMGSVWPRFANRVIETGYYDAVVMITIAQGSSAIVDWAPDGKYHHKLMRAIKSIQGIGMPITHVVWHQGETDADIKTPEEVYKEKFLIILESIRSEGVLAPVYLCIASLCFDDLGDEVIQRAQRSLCSEKLGIYEGANTDMLGSQYRYDNCHFNEKGLEAFADMLVKCMISLRIHD